MKKQKLSIIISVILIIIFIALLCVVGIGNNDKKESDSNSLDNNEECCEGCICGDTIEMLKNIETAWTLTEINRDGEYEYSRHSFINFHGTGKNKFAFFLNDDDANTISEVRGEFSINEKNEIILIPNNDKSNKITCKLGEEKDLIAVMNCDKDFGVFTIQKQGKLELPNVITNTISKTKSIVVKTYQLLNTEKDKYGYKEIKIITEESEINKIISVINNSKIWTGATTLPMPKYELDLLDSNNDSLATILYSPNFSIELNNRSYELTDIDKDVLNTVLEK